MEFVKNFTPPDFQAKNFTPSISPNFNSFSDKSTKNEWKWRNLHRWQKFYTSAGSDGIDKFQLWDGHLIFTGLKCNVQSFIDRPRATAITLRGEFLFKSLLKLPEVDFPPKVSVVQLTWVFFSRVSVWRQDGILRWVSLATNRLWKTCGASSLPRVLVRSVAVENTQGWYQWVMRGAPSQEH